MQRLEQLRAIGETPPAHELVDATSVRGDREALRARVAADGYLFFRALLEPDVVHDACERILAVAQHHRWLEHAESGWPRLRAVPGVESEDFWRLYADIQRLEPLHRLAHRPELVDLMRTLVGADVFVYPQRIFRLAWPVALGGRPGIDSHRDFTGWRTQDMFTTWIPFTECPRERGGLWIRRGSQNDGLKAPPGLDEADPDWLTTDYRPGDVLVFHCLTVHSGTANRTSLPRLSGDYRWQSASVPAWSFVLEADGQVGDWRDLTAGWSSREWVSVPDELETVPAEGPLWEPRPTLPPSRFVRIGRWPRRRGRVGRQRR